MKAVLYIGSVLAVLAGLVGRGMAFFGNAVETVQGITILGSDFAFVLLLVLLNGAIEIRRNTVIVSNQLDQALKALGVKDPVGDRNAAAEVKAPPK